MIKPDGMRESAATYLAGADPRHPYASPLYADMHGLPPILIQVGDAEVILDDSTRFAAKARAAGVDVTLEVWDQMPHVWHAFAGLLPESGQVIGGSAAGSSRAAPGADRQARFAVVPVTVRGVPAWRHGTRWPGGGSRCGSSGRRP